MSRTGHRLVWILLVAAFVTSTACFPSCNIPLPREQPHPPAAPKPQPAPAEPHP